MSQDLVLVERRETVGILKLNRPRARNALSPALLEELQQGLASLGADDRIAAIIITGSDAFFCGTLRFITSRFMNQPFYSRCRYHSTEGPNYGHRLHGRFSPRFRGKYTSSSEADYCSRQWFCGAPQGVTSGPSN